MSAIEEAELFVYRQNGGLIFQKLFIRSAFNTNNEGRGKVVIIYCFSFPFPPLKHFAIALHVSQQCKQSSSRPPLLATSLQRSSWTLPPHLIHHTKYGIPPNSLPLLPRPLARPRSPERQVKSPPPRQTREPRLRLAPRRQKKHLFWPRERHLRWQRPRYFRHEKWRQTFKNILDKPSFHNAR